MLHICYLFISSQQFTYKNFWNNPESRLEETDVAGHSALFSLPVLKNNKIKN